MLKHFKRSTGRKIQPSLSEELLEDYGEELSHSIFTSRISSNVAWNVLEIAETGGLK